MTGTVTRPLFIKRVRDEARDTRSFDMLTEGAQGKHGLTFTPGQVAMLRVGDERPSYFAFASAPEDEEVEFLVKHGGGTGGLFYEMSDGSRVELV
nr:hypothetical protein [Acidobacteriota bacterium]